MDSRCFNKIFLVVCGLLFIVLLGACSSSNDSEANGQEVSGEDSKDGGILNIGLSANPQTLDPVLYTGIYESQVMASIGDTLLSYSKDLSTIEPSIATDWKVSDDFKVYTFTLREDVYFHPGEYQDGRQMVAEDVKYSLERSIEDSASGRLRAAEKVEVTGEFEVEVHLPEPNAAILAMLTDTGNIIIPEEEVEGWGDEFSSNLIGTGPFSMKEWKKDQEIVLERHDKYWGEKPHLDGVRFQFISDTSMMANALRSGDLDIATDIKGQSREVIEQDENLELISEPALSISYLDFNHFTGPTADKKVREAIYKATNVEEIVKGSNQWGGAEVNLLPLPKNSWGYDEKLTELAPTYDPEAARELLAETDYSDGFETEIYINDSRVSHATIFQNQMKENLNIDVDIKVVEWGTYSDTISEGKAPMSMGSWNWYPDPDFFLYQLFHSDQIGALGNGKGYSNPEVDALLEKAVEDTVDQEERTEIYHEALEIIMGDVTRIELDNLDVTAGISDKVQDFNVSPNMGIRIVVPGITNVWLDE